MHQQQELGCSAQVERGYAGVSSHEVQRSGGFGGLSQRSYAANPDPLLQHIRPVAALLQGECRIAVSDGSQQRNRRFGGFPVRERTVRPHQPRQPVAGVEEQRKEVLGEGATGKPQRLSITAADSGDIPKQGCQGGSSSLPVHALYQLPEGIGNRHAHQIQRFG